MRVRLHSATPLTTLAYAIRFSHSSHDRSDSSEDGLGSADLRLIRSVIGKGHDSVLEHVTYQFTINGISRLVLQELARHRMASMVVKSSRYTLNELKKIDFGNPPFTRTALEKASRFVNFVYWKVPSKEASAMDEDIMLSLIALQNHLKAGVKPDQAKYLLPESYKTDLFWTINARSMRNFLKLRLARDAHFEIRELAGLVFQSIPQDHHILYDEIINFNGKN